MEHIKFIDLKPRGKLISRLNIAYDRVFNSGTYIGGLEVEAFENEWAEYCHAEYCASTGNGYDALFLSCKYFTDSIEENYRPTCYVPWKTCIPTWAAVKNAGFSPVPFVDMADKYFTVVHIYGMISEDIVDTLGKRIVEDCAQAHGSKRNGTMAGKYGDVAAWSFYPTKNLGALGDGGAITTDNIDIYEYIMIMRSYGNPGDYGVNSRLDPLQAAILRVKLNFLDEWNKRRAENAEAYFDTIEENDKISLPKVHKGEEPNWHIFPIEVKNHGRYYLVPFLSKNGVETKSHYSTVPYPPNWDIPKAEEWTRTTLSLPIAPHITPDTCRKIGNLINQWSMHDIRSSL